VFSPSKEETRRFFCDAWRKHREGRVLTPMEALIAKWVGLHPEYHALLDDPEAAAVADFSVERGESNPFLHLSLHVAIDEQLAIDQPTGIRAVFETLRTRAGDTHAAAHEAMECLGRIVWEAQRGTLPADPNEINAAYLDCLQRRVG
jgi:hypothetical protein